MLRKRPDLPYWKSGRQRGKNKKTAITNSGTRAEQVKAQAVYTGVIKQVKKSIRTEKQKYVEDLATTAEKAASEGNMKQLNGNEEPDKKI
ncbi:unnamed protein product [Schistosoma mattheei]|uniref:Uncharacterized protein n=1 Tax=Schistosoma mattheei TaxID=31246 RepID=A0A183P6T7_9TREM|nr:unnamed protein product [Schistosoma mattheei]